MATKGETKRMTNYMRKGQKLVNYVMLKGWSYEKVHQAIFYMSDTEFERILNLPEKEITKMCNKKRGAS
jgi:hypothetical protein